MKHKEQTEFQPVPVAAAESNNYNRLIDGIGDLIAQSKQHIATTINTTLVQTYWQIGKYIVEFEQNGNNRAEYGKQLIQQLARDLTLRYGKGLSKSNSLSANPNSICQRRNNCANSCECSLRMTKATIGKNVII